MTTDERNQTWRLLRLARAYVAKANEQGAYAGCAMSGERVLERLDAAIDAMAQSPEFQAPIQGRLEY
jgi:hypothetical protein